MGNEATKEFTTKQIREFRERRRASYDKGYAAIIDRIGSLCKEQGVYVSKLSSETGIYERKLYDILNFRTAMDVHDFTRIARALGVSCKSLFDEETIE